MKKDTLFNSPGSGKTPFSFDDSVASVFDDMATRSIPSYQENIKMLSKIASRYYKKGQPIVDLGASTGNSLFACLHELKGEGEYIAIEPSEPMIKRITAKVAFLAQKPALQIINQTIQNAQWENASVTILQYVLQFIPSAERLSILQKVYDGLAPGGVLILSEKVHADQPGLEELQTSFYYDFKREQGYSELEISQKRDALEKVLITDSLNVQVERLKSAGFQDVLIWSKWFNFASFLCIKEGSSC